MCPRCRHRVEQELGPRLVRCPQHPKSVLVTPRAIAAADGDPFLGRIIGGRFAVLDLIGAGSMGTVYRARHEAMGRDVALKIVRADRLADKHAKSRFQQEAHATSLLSSPHTVTVFDFGEIDSEDLEGSEDLAGSLFLAMELLDGEAVGDRLKKSGPMDPALALMVVRHTLQSLAEAHDKGVIHRDLKPDNLLITKTADGATICKVLDFGIAKMLTRDGRMDALETQAGTVFGTPRYMSPEQAQGKKLDARSDLYSLGVILYHMLAGRPPFTDGDAVVVMAHHIKTVPKRPSEVAPELHLPAEVEALLMRVLDKSPDKRPQSAREFIDELDRLPFSGSGELTAVMGGPQRAPKRRVVLVAAAASAAGILLLIALGLSGSRDSQARPARPALGSVAGQLARAAVSAAAEPSATAQASATATTAEALPEPSASPAAAAPTPQPLHAPRSNGGYTKFR